MLARCGAAESYPGATGCFFNQRSLASPIPQPARRDARALSGCGELHPDDLLRHVFAAGESAKAAIRSGDHPLAVADHRYCFLESPRDKLRMLDKIRCGIKN